MVFHTSGTSIRRFVTPNFGTGTLLTRGCRGKNLRSSLGLSYSHVITFFRFRFVGQRLHALMRFSFVFEPLIEINECRSVRSSPTVCTDHAFSFLTGAFERLVQAMMRSTDLGHSLEIERPQLENRLSLSN